MESPAEASTASPSLPVDLRPLTAENVAALRCLNSTLFPVAYTEKFYTDAVAAPALFHRLAYVCDVLVGAVCCRREVPRTADGADDICGAKLYIMTLGVLAPYRECGVGSALLRHVIDVLLLSPWVEGTCEVFLHVQVGNDDALSFYQGHGFVVKQRLVDYYRKIQPADCFYVGLDVVTTGLRQFGEV